jgi:hypothetical protein
MGTIEKKKQQLNERKKKCYCPPTCRTGYKVKELKKGVMWLHVIGVCHRSLFESVTVAFLMLRISTILPSFNDSDQWLYLRYYVDRQHGLFQPKFCKRYTTSTKLRRV